MAWWDLSSLSCFKNSRDSLSQDAPMRILEVTESTSQSCSSVYDPLINRKGEEKRVQNLISSLAKSRDKSSIDVFSSCLSFFFCLLIARAHMYDWLVLMLLVVVKTILHFVHPFYRFVGKDMMTYLKYPLKSNTVPAWAVQVFSTLLPMVIYLIVYIRRRDFYDLHHATLGLLFSVLVTTVITDSIKDAVGRPRPDFFWRCFPDGKDVYDHLGDVICHGDKNVVREGYKSFPSGHTSWAFAGLGFLSLYMCGKIKAFDHRGHVAKLCIVFLPLFVACLVGISRVDDYWHHWQDVFAGACLGMTVATFCYLQFFPPPYHPQGCRPYAYFQALEESRAGLHTDNAMNPISTEVMEAEESDRDDASKAISGPHPANDSRSTTEDVEWGRK